MSVGYPATISGLNFDQFSALQDFQFENYKANPISFALLLELLLRNHLIFEFQLTHSNFSTHIVFKPLAKIMHWAVKNIPNSPDFFMQEYEIRRRILIIKMFCLLFFEVHYLPILGPNFDCFKKNLGKHHEDNLIVICDQLYNNSLLNMNFTNSNFTKTRGF